MIRLPLFGGNPISTTRAHSATNRKPDHPLRTVTGPVARRAKLGSVDEETLERVRGVVASIPPGSVLGYGDVADLAGLRSARLVGRILAEDGADLPWHRVLRSDGSTAQHLRHRQLELLRGEGVLADRHRVSMRRYRWAPKNDQPKADPPETD